MADLGLGVLGTSKFLYHTPTVQYGIYCCILGPFTKVLAAAWPRFFIMEETNRSRSQLSPKPAK